MVQFCQTFTSLRAGKWALIIVYSRCRLPVKTGILRLGIRHCRLKSAWTSILSLSFIVVKRYLGHVIAHFSIVSPVLICFIPFSLLFRHFFFFDSLSLWFVFLFAAMPDLAEGSSSVGRLSLAERD